MKIIIKVLGGPECRVEVNDNVTIKDLKEMVSAVLEIPTLQQKLVCKGRTLQDEKDIGSYKYITEGTKIYLIIKKKKIYNLNDEVVRFFLKHYDAPTAQKLSLAFIQHFDQKMASLSLDDIERIAKYYLEHPQSGGATNKD